MSSPPVGAEMDGSAGAGRLTLSNEIRATIWLAAPLCVALLAEMALGFIEYKMAGALGADALAVAGIGIQLVYVPKLLAMGTLYSVAALGSHAFGADDIKQFVRVMRQGLRLALFLSVPVMIVLAVAGDGLRLIQPIFPNFEVDIDVVERLLWWSIPSVPAFLWFQTLRNFVTVLGRPIIVTVIAVLSIPLLALLLWLMMLEPFGLPTLGVPAIGMAISIVAWAQLAMAVIYVRHVPYFAVYQIFSGLFHHDARLIRDLVVVGAPIAGAYLFETGMFFGSTLAMGGFGNAVLAAHNAVLNVTSITFMVPYAIGQAATVRVGYALGAGQANNARLAGYVGIGLGLTWMVMAAITMALAPVWLTGLYLDLDDVGNAAALAAAVTLFPIAAIFQFFDGLQVTALGALRGYKDTKVPMLIAFVGYWLLGIGGGIGLAYYLDVRGPGIWWGLAIGLLGSGLMLLLRFDHLSRRRIRVTL
ncbi:MATE family efflux transporter [Dongia sp.]|uniref:MATE family efflux transporter n=1 Tax=Dongia sp. TaxID=1977262 RepID=UPI0035B23DB8